MVNCFHITTIAISYLKLLTNLKYFNSSNFYNITDNEISYLKLLTNAKELLSLL